MLALERGRAGAGVLARGDVLARGARARRRWCEGSVKVGGGLARAEMPCLPGFPAEDVKVKVVF